MKCSKCGEKLNEKWVACPFCGTEVPKAPKTIDEYLKEFVDDYGPSIFKEENSNRLDRFMGDWPDTYADDRDIIKLLQIKNIPDMLSSALDQSDDEKNKVVQDSANILCDKFGINGETASKMISLITNAIGLKTTVAVGNGMGTFRDPRDGQVYKTCKIGDQVWLAENLRYDCGDGCYVYNDDYQYLDKYGYMYSREASKKAIPEGWHLPTKDELRTLEKFIVKTNRCKHALPYLVSKEWFSDNYKKNYISSLLSEWEQNGVINTYGFSAQLGGAAEINCNKKRFSNLGLESFWLYQEKDKYDDCVWSLSSPTDYDYDLDRGCGIKFVGVVSTHYYIRLIKD